MKTPLYYLAALLTGCLIVSSPLSVSAQEQEKEKGKSKTGKKEDKAKRTVPFRGTVKSSDRNSMSVTVEGKDKVQVINVSSETRIMKAGKPATFADIAVGDDVRAVVKQNAEGKETADTILIQSPAAGKDEKKDEDKKDGEKKKKKSAE
jgi:hypothetical protein